MKILLFLCPNAGDLQRKPRGYGCKSASILESWCLQSRKPSM